MDGWGALTMLMKRQNSDKYRKAKSRYNQQKRREGFLQDSYENPQSLEFPEISQKEMDILKKEIHTELRKQRLSNILSYVKAIALIAAFLLLIYLYN